MTARSSGAFVVVVDASTLVDMLLNRPLAPALRTRLILSGEVLHAPYMIDLEVLQALRRFVLARQVTIQRAEEAIEDHLALRIERYPHDPLLRRAWELRANITAYDAAYVALAEKLRATFVTLDVRLARACPPTVRVELFA
ncbi:MAG TPA: type II toxin-antitoxin system VapC family toxin [Thermoanaerobaculia bacterium]|nr:type II toxin-antitoxin system VapC family toxin [Thermoanaerobaculia bacterium]